MPSAVPKNRYVTQVSFEEYLKNIHTPHIVLHYPVRIEWDPLVRLTMNGNPSLSTPSDSREQWENTLEKVIADCARLGDTFQVYSVTDNYTTLFQRLQIDEQYKNAVARDPLCVLFVTDGKITRKTARMDQVESVVRAAHGV